MRYIRNIVLGTVTSKFNTNDHDISHQQSEGSPSSGWCLTDLLGLQGEVLKNQG